MQASKLAFIIIKANMQFHFFSKNIKKKINNINEEAEKLQTAETRLNQEHIRQFFKR